MRFKNISFLIMFLANFCLAQNKQILYGFYEIPQTLLQNPGGRIDNKGYFGIPLLSHIHVNGGSSGISIYDLFAEDGRDFNLKIRNAVNQLRPNDFFTATQQIEVFSGGFSFGPSYNKNKYISFGLYQELDFIGYFPKDYAVLALEGNQVNIGKPFNLSHFSLNADVLSVLHVGYNKQINDNFTFGVRGKIYSSVFNVNSTRNKGKFVTVAGENNIYDHIFNLDLSLRTSGIASLLDDENDDFQKDIKTIKKRLLFGQNLGLGFDVGFTHQINNQWYWDASLLDVGFVRHTKDVENYELKDDFVFEGIDPLFPESENGQTADDYWSEIEQEFKDLFDLRTTQEKYTVWRPIKFNTSLNYAFGKKKIKDCDCLAEERNYLNRVGMQLFIVNRPKGLQAALTAYYYRRIFNRLSAKVTYTLDSYNYSNIGLGVSANLWGLNVYVMADNFLAYQNLYDAQNVSLQLGLNYIFKNEN
ncbi:hypothetical protein SAMN05421824_2124 [Hyunsoonleella jejuensis]|uniref:DUF5723 domain-containing protein n=1 Tax=Hyunsoonleella jejuensis TaxID=419940 RepID=A0A1H9IBJ3_9FLAO|nr:hypothetical protein SAMN05421824_2124 [Hyunsoonleella jejuensis]